MSARNPVDVFVEMRAAFDNCSDPRTRVLRVRDAMLSEAEREAAASVAEPDERGDDEWVEMDRFIGSQLDSARWTAPEVLFHKQHRAIGQAILRQCEIAAINKAYEAQS
jgi:hypothetical protein